MAAKTEKTEEGGKAPKKKSKKKLIIIVVVLIAGGYGYMQMTAKKPVVKPGTPVALGPIMPLEATTLNLADGHYLQVTMALQLALGVKATALTLDAPRVVDTAISIIGTGTQATLTTPVGREKAKTDLTAALVKEYPDKITAVYFTQFVIQ